MDDGLAEDDAVLAGLTQEDEVDPAYNCKIVLNKNVWALSTE